jgi:hypothetical protein
MQPLLAAYCCLIMLGILSDINDISKLALLLFSGDLLYFMVKLGLNPGPSEYGELHNAQYTTIMIL